MFGFDDFSNSSYNWSGFNDFSSSSHNRGGFDESSRTYNYSVSHALSDGDIGSAITAYSTDRIVVLGSPLNTNSSTDFSNFIGSTDTDFTSHYRKRNISFEDPTLLKKKLALYNSLIPLLHWVAIGLLLFIANALFLN